MKEDVSLKPKEARGLEIVERILANKVSVRQAAVQDTGRTSLPGPRADYLV